MAEKLFYVGTCATNDPTLASLPFVVAIGAKTVYGVGFPPLPELLEKTIAAGIPIHV